MKWKGEKNNLRIIGFCQPRIRQFYKSEFIKVSLSFFLSRRVSFLTSGRISNNLLTLMLFSVKGGKKLTRSSREIYNFRFLRESFLLANFPFIDSRACFEKPKSRFLISPLFRYFNGPTNHLGPGRGI